MAEKETKSQSKNTSNTQKKETKSTSSTAKKSIATKKISSKASSSKAKASSKKKNAVVKTSASKSLTKTHVSKTSTAPKKSVSPKFRTTPSNTTKPRAPTKTLLKSTSSKSSSKLSKLAKKIKLPFEIGEYIFYPNTGIGQIESTEDRELQDESTPYYVINFASQKLITRIPIKNYKMVKMRKIISKTAVKNTLKVFETVPEKNDLSWKDRLLVYQEINNKGNSLEMAGMLTILYMRRKAKNQLSFQERQIYEFALEAIGNEISIILHIPKEKAIEEILSRLEKTFGNSKKE